MKPSLEKVCHKTQRAILWMHVLNEPMVALYTLMPFILVKDFGASVFEVSLFIAIRPILTFFSYFWGINLSKKKTNLISHVMTSYMLAYLPFILLSFTGNIWFILISAGFYQLFYKAGLPGWVEVTQQNLPKKMRENAFSWSFVIGFIISCGVGIFLGVMLDAKPQSLRILLPLFSLIGLANLFLLIKIPTTQSQPEINPLSPSKRESHMSAIKKSWDLMQRTPDFWMFQVAFTIGAGSLMLMSPSLSLFYVKVLSLTHAQITIARFFFMALGVISTTFLWKKGLRRFHVNVLSIWILGGFGLFALFILFAQMNICFLYMAFLFYGVSQAGSHLVWNLSGPIFANGNDSIPYTQANLLMIGIRGLIFPLLGGIVATVLDTQSIIGLSLFICFAGAFVLHKFYATRYAPIQD